MHFGAIFASPRKGERKGEWRQHLVYALCHNGISVEVADFCIAALEPPQVKLHPLAVFELWNMTAWRARDSVNMYSSDV